jgi:hypothetical protein
MGYTLLTSQSITLLTCQSNTLPHPLVRLQLLQLLQLPTRSRKADADMADTLHGQNVVSTDGA